MAKKKTEKQLTPKQQMMQQIANYQVQTALGGGQNQQQNGIQQLQAEYDKWNAVQSLQSEYDTWLKAQQPQTPKVTKVQQTYEPVKFATAEERRAMKAAQQLQKDAPFDPEKSYDKVYGKGSLNAAAKSLTGANQIPKVEEYVQAFRAEDNKKKEVLKEIAKDKSPKKSYMEVYTEQSLKRKDQDPEVRQGRTRVRSQQIAADMADITGKNRKADTSLDMSTYRSKKDNSKVNFEELASKLKKSYKERGVIPFTRQYNNWKNPYSELSADEKQAVKDFIVANQDKTNLSKADKETLRALTVIYNTSGEKNIDTSNALKNSESDAYKNAMAFGGGFTSFNAPLTKLLASGVDKLPIAGQAIDENFNQQLDDLLDNAKEKNPELYEAGRSAGQLYDYALTSPIANTLGAAANLGTAGTVALNQAIQAGQDLGLDILPEAQRMLKENGAIDWGELSKRAGVDLVSNAAMEAIPFLGSANYDYLAKTVGNNADIFRRMDASGAVRNVPDAIREIDDLVNGATRQANEAAANIDNLASQIPEVDPTASINNQFSDIMRRYNTEAPSMRDVYTADDLSRSMDNQFSELMKQRPQEPVNSIPSLEELQELEREARVMDDIDDYSNIWANPANNTPTANTPTRIDLPEDVQELLVSDFQDMYRMMDDMSAAAEATGNEAVLKKFERLQNRMFDLENTLWKSESTEDITKAKRAADAARQAFIREMRKVNPSYQAELTGTRIGNAAYRRTSMIPDEKVSQELADSIIEAENTLPQNRYAVDATPDSVNVFRGVEDNANLEHLRKLEDAYNKLPEITEPSPYRYTEPSILADGTYARKPRENAHTQWFKSAPQRTVPYTAEEIAEVNNYLALEKEARKLPQSTNKELENELNKATWTLHDRILNKYPELFVGDSFKYDADSWFKDAYKQSVSPSIENAAKTQPIDSDDLVMYEDIGLNPKTDFEYEITEIPESQAPKGEVIASDSTGVKERGQSRHIRNADTPMKMEGVSDEVAADFEKNPDMYAVLKNKDTKAKAERIYTTSDNPEADFREMLSRKDPAALPLGHQLAKDYSAMGNHSAAAQIYRDMGEALTQSGQFSQAAIINMVKNDPMTALEYAQKEINKLNDIGKQRFGAKWKDFELTSDEINQFKQIQPGDGDRIKSVFDMIGSRLGKEYPTTPWEKIIEARRVAMLFNPRTNVRNILANPPTLAMRWVADRAEAVGQNVAHLINPNVRVTQSLYGSGVKGRKIADEIYNSSQVQSLLKGSGSKSELPELKNAVMTRKQVFKGSPVSKFIDKMTGGGIQKANEYLFGVKGVQSTAETIRNATYKLLDLGDRPFVKENFIERLGSYIAAQGYKNAAQVPEEAIMMAWEEAMKATYKDNSWAVEMLKGAKKSIEKADNIVPGLGTAISQSAIPFVQAPGNIAARMIDYSPVNTVKGLSNIIAGAKKGNVKAIEKGIEEAAKGLSGTGLIILGMKLRESGVLTGTYSENNRQKAFEKQNGFKEFAIHAGDHYFTYGWAQPFAQTLMIGTLLQDAIEKSDEYDSDILRHFNIEGTTAGKAIGVAKAGTKAAVNSWFNESPISGLADFFRGNSYSDTDIAGNIWQNGVEDFAGALVPAVVNATAKSVDPIQRNTFDKTNAFSSFINANKAKIPKVSEQLPAKYDTWGREMRYAETKGRAALTKFFNPGEYGYDKHDAIDDEINRLYEATGEMNVFPPEAEYSVGDMKLDNWGVSTYQEDMGKRNRKLAESFINSNLYNQIDDKEKAEILNNLYGASKVITKRDKFNYEIPNNSSHKKAIEIFDEAGGGDAGIKAMTNYYTSKKIMADSGVSAESKAAESIQAAVNRGDLASAQKLADSEAKYQEALDKAGIDGSKAARKVYEESGAAGLQKYAKYDTTLDKYGLSNTESNRAMLDKYGESGLKEHAAFDSLGSEEAFKRYQHAKSSNSGLSASEYVSTVKKIDGTGDKGNVNGNISQDELIAYLNEINATQDEANKLWNTYGQYYSEKPWAKIPKLEGGVWKAKKK